MASPASHHDQQTYRRATQAAIIGLVVQFLLAAAAAFIALWAQSPALHAVAWHLFGGMPIWLVLILLYNQHRLERVEALEAEQLARTDARAAALFDEHADQLAVARRRLDNLYKWGLGIASLLVGAYLVIVGLVLVYRANVRLEADELVSKAVGPEVSFIALAFLATGLAFLAFIVGRYEAGMTQVKEWQLLRGGASYLMGSALVALLAAIGAGIAAAFGNTTTLGYLALVVPGITAVLGIEVFFNFLLGLYRPRKPGEVPRPAFDSRLLGMLTSPESIAKALGEAINYQFGFEVSRSWFYQLLSRAVTPLFILGLIVLWAMSCVIVVGPQQQALILKMGSIDGEPRLPGVHFKLPYPFGRVEKYDVGRVHQIEVGSAPKGLKAGAALLWTNPHVEEGSKEDFLITAPTQTRTSRGADTAAKVPGMSLIGGQVVVQYRIKPDELVTYARNVDDPARLLKAIAERQVSSDFVTKDIDTLIGPGRIAAGDRLRGTIQQEATRANLGLEIVFVGLLGLHPPQDSEVAQAFHNQIGALQRQQTEINKARKEAIETLAGVAGSLEEARAIEAAINRYEDADQSRKTALVKDAQQLAALQKAVDEAKAELDRLLASAQGESAQLINEAMAYRWTYALERAGDARRFEAELTAYQKSPLLYRARNYYQTIAEATAGARKIVLTSGHSEDPVFRIDLKDTSAGVQSLLDAKGQ